MANLFDARLSKFLILFISHLAMISCMSEVGDAPPEQYVCNRTFDIENSNVLSLIEEIKPCNRITGWVFIRNVSIVEDLSFLSALKRVDSGVIIKDNINLKSLDGLENLEHVEYSLDIESNPSLKDIKLGALAVQGDMRLIENNALGSIALNSLSARSIYIYNNLELERIDVASHIHAKGLWLAGNQKITRVHGLSAASDWSYGLDIWNNRLLQEVAFNSPIRGVAGRVMFWNNPLLDTFTDFHRLETIGQNFEIKGCGTQDLTAFPSLREIMGDFRIENNLLMTAVSGLDGLKSVSGELRISGNQILEKIDDFPLLHTAGSIAVVNNPALKEAFSVPLVDKIDRYLVVSGNASLTHIPTFDSLKKIEKGLYIYGNPQIKNLGGLGELNKVNGIVVLKNNLMTINDLSKLESVDGHIFIEEPNLEDPILLSNLVNMKKVVVGTPTSILKVAESNGKIFQEAPSVYMYATDISNFKSRICTNEIYESPEDLSGCYYVAGSILLKDIAGLESLDFIDSIMHVEGDLEINNNPNLRAVNIEQELNYLGGNLIIKDNLSLESIVGFDGLRSVGEGVYVNGNPSLSLVNGFKQLNSVGSGFYDFERLSYQENIFNNGISFARNALDFEVVGFDAISWLYSLSLYGDSIALNGFSSLSSVGSLTVGDVRTISIPDALVKIDNSVFVNITNLLDLSAFNGIEEIGQNLRIVGRFESIPGFDGLLAIGGLLDIQTSLYTLDLTDGFNRLLYCGQPNIQTEPAIFSLPDDDYDSNFNAGLERFLVRIAGKEYTNEAGTFCGRP